VPVLSFILLLMACTSFNIHSLKDQRRDKMRSIAALTLSLAVFTASPVLAKCRSVCHAENCARAVTGTRQGPEFTSMAKSDCSSFVVTTSYGHTVYGGPANACVGNRS
jgi:hypothetical protein